MGENFRGEIESNKIDHDFIAPEASQNSPKEIKEAEADRIKDDWKDGEMQNKGKESRFKFYYHRKSTENNPDILSAEEVDSLKEKLFGLRELEREYRNELSKNPEFEERINKSKERIARLGNKLGLDLENRFIENKDIHILPEEIYERFVGGGASGGLANTNINEIAHKKMPEREKSNIDLIMYDIQHELLHSVTVNKFFLNRIKPRYLGTGYQDDYRDSFRFFQEGLTEVTNQQLYAEDGELPPELAYNEEVILVIEMVKDLAQKTNRLDEDILAQLQTGMFEGKRGYLKIIADVYGQKALNKLKKMKHGEKSVSKVAKELGLNEVVQKIREMNKGEITSINLGKINLDFEMDKLSCKEYLAKFFSGIIQKIRK